MIQITVIMKEIVKKLAKYEKNIIIKPFKKDQILFRERTLCDFICVVDKGVVEISSLTQSGNVIVYNTLKENDVFGINLLFSSRPYFKGDAYAKTDGNLFLIKKKILLKLLQSNVEFLEEYLRYQSDFSKKLNQDIKLLTISDAKERFMYYLAANSNSFAYESITSLAKKLFLARETLSRVINRLELQGVIQINNKIIKLMKNE